MTVMRSFLWSFSRPYALLPWRSLVLMLSFGALGWLSLASLRLPHATRLRNVLHAWRDTTGIPCDKAVHCALYFGVCLLLGWVLAQRFERRTAPIWACLTANGIGLLMEGLQGALSYYGFAQRAFDLHDAIANLLGATLATLVLLLRARHPRKSGHSIP